jgi:hypothetical protein
LEGCRHTTFFFSSIRSFPPLGRRLSLLSREQVSTTPRVQLQLQLPHQARQTNIEHHTRLWWRDLSKFIPNNPFPCLVFGCSLHHWGAKSQQQNRSYLKLWFCA